MKTVYPSLGDSEIQEKLRIWQKRKKMSDFVRALVEIPKKI